VSSQLHAPDALPPGKDLPVSIDRTLGRPQGPAGRGGEKSLHMPEIEPLSPSPRVVTVLIELSRFLSSCYPATFFLVLQLDFSEGLLHLWLRTFEFHERRII
jgi:hypothetical protein